MGFDSNRDVSNRFAAQNEMTNTLYAEHPEKVKVKGRTSGFWRMSIRSRK
jgi:hypothetical protein